MSDSIDEKLAVKVDVLAEYFLKLLQRDGVISNYTYLAAVKKIKEEKNVNSKQVFKGRDKEAVQN